MLHHRHTHLTPFRRCFFTDFLHSSTTPTSSGRSPSPILLQKQLKIRTIVTAECVQFCTTSQLHSSQEINEWQTVMCSNGVIACWHPPKQFPYEHSRPFNMEKALEEKEKFLNRKNDETLNTHGPDANALREIFYTNLHEWRSIYREKRLYKAKVDDELKPVPSNPLETPDAPVIARDVGTHSEPLIEGGTNGENPDSKLSE